MLHVPSFRRDYEAVDWAEPAEQVIEQRHQKNNNNNNTAFLVQLKLVLALGALVHDDTFTLRPSAVRWVYEAQTYLADPARCKAHLTIPALQTRVLLLLARELVDVGEDAAWAESGALLRTATCMGLHRDPAALPRMPCA